MAESVKPVSHHITMQPQTEKPVTKESVTVFIKRNIREASYNRLVCGDGRFTEDQTKGGLHMFGGDMGALAAFWKAGKEARHFTSIDQVSQAVEEYRNAKVLALKDLGVSEEDARRLYLHTDGHGDDAHGIYGCGHMKNLSSGNYAGKGLYDTDNQELNALFQYVINPDNHIDHELTQLTGAHAEKTVIYVHGPKGSRKAAYTLNASDAEEMHFVVDYDRVMEYFNRLSTALHIKEVTADALQKSYQQHELTTAKILAAGKQIVHAYITDKNTVDIAFDESEKIPAL